MDSPDLLWPRPLDKKPKRRKNETSKADPAVGTGRSASAPFPNARGNAMPKKLARDLGRKLVWLVRFYLPLQ